MGPIQNNFIRSFVLTEEIKKFLFWYAPELSLPFKLAGAFRDSSYMPMKALWDKLLNTITDIQSLLPPYIFPHDQGNLRMRYFHASDLLDPSIVIEIFRRMNGQKFQHFSNGPTTYFTEQDEVKETLFSVKGYKSSTKDEERIPWTSTIQKLSLLQGGVSKFDSTLEAACNFSFNEERKRKASQVIFAELPSQNILYAVTKSQNEKGAYHLYKPIHFGFIAASFLPSLRPPYMDFAPEGLDSEIYKRHLLMSLGRHLLGLTDVFSDKVDFLKNK